MSARRPDALEKIRRICLSWKGAREGVSWNAPVFWAGDRQFAIYVDNHHDDGVTAVWTKAAEGVQAALVKSNPSVFFSPPYVGVKGWVGIRLDRRPDWKAVESLLGDAFVMTAPKRLADAALAARGKAGAQEPSERIDTAEQALAFVERHGVVLQSARGPVPSLADAIAGEAIRGGWWSHPAGKRIFDVLQIVDGSPDVLVCKLVDAKVTYVHRRQWPALVRLEARFGRSRLARVREEHTSKGSHRTRRLAFPKWVPPEVLRAAASLTTEQAESSLPPGLLDAGRGNKGGRRAPRRKR
jgi:hypothetical protein